MDEELEQLRKAERDGATYDDFASVEPWVRAAVRAGADFPPLPASLVYDELTLARRQADEYAQEADALRADVARLNARVLELEDAQNALDHPAGPPWRFHCECGEILPCTEHAP